MAFRESLTPCPRCDMQTAIDLILINEHAVVRVIGGCTNPDCRARNICLDIDPVEFAIESASSSLTPYCTVQSRAWGN